VHLKMAFNNVEDLMLVFLPVRRLMSGLRHILRYAETSTCVFVLDEKGHIYSEYVRVVLDRASV
jgi:hypothetical protein